MPHVLLTGMIHRAGMELLESRADVTLESIDNPTEADFAARLPRADALIVRTAVVPPAALEGAGAPAGDFPPRVSATTMFRSRP